MNSAPDPRLKKAANPHAASDQFCREKGCYPEQLEPADFAHYMTLRAREDVLIAARNLACAERLKKTLAKGRAKILETGRLRRAARKEEIRRIYERDPFHCRREAMRTLGVSVSTYYTLLTRSLRSSDHRRHRDIALQLPLHPRQWMRCVRADHPCTMLRALRVRVLVPRLSPRERNG